MRMLRVLALSLGLPPGHFDGQFARAMLALRPLHYTATQSDPEAGIFAAGAHTGGCSLAGGGAREDCVLLACHWDCSVMRVGEGAWLQTPQGCGTPSPLCSPVMWVCVLCGPCSESRRATARAPDILSCSPSTPPADCSCFSFLLSPRQSVVNPSYCCPPLPPHLQTTAVSPSCAPMTYRGCSSSPRRASGSTSLPSRAPTWW